MLDRLNHSTTTVEQQFQPTATQPSNAVNTVNSNGNTTSAVSDLNFYGSMQRNNLYAKLGLPEKVPADPNEPPKPTQPVVTTYDTLKSIEEIPKPDRSGIPRNLSPEDQQAIYDERVRQYNEQRLALANEGINSSRQPTRDDFKDLPLDLAEAEYKETLSNYNIQIAELKKISREAKQGNLELTPEFKNLSSENQQLVRDQLAKLESNPDDFDTLIKLVKTEGFTKLKPDEQKKLLNYVGGINNEISQPARQEMSNWLNNPSVDKSNPETFRKFLREQPGLSYLIRETGSSGEFDGKGQPYTISGPEAYDTDPVANDLVKQGEPHGPRRVPLNSKEADIKVYYVNIDGKKIKITDPVKKDPNKTYQTVDEIAKGLAAVPKHVRENVKAIRIEPHPDPDGAGASAGSDGIIHIYPGKLSHEALVVRLFHETAHIISLGEMGDDPISRWFNNQFETGWNDWQEVMKKDGFSPSGYAKKNPREDFAETYALYIKVKGTPEEAEMRALMPERFKFIGIFFE